MLSLYELDPPSAPLPVPEAVPSTAENLAIGKAVYQSVAECWTCHGRLGHGDGPSYKIEGFTDEQHDILGDYVVWDKKTNAPKAINRDDVGGRFEKKGLDPAMEEEQSLARALIYRFIAATHRPGLQPRYLST